MSKQDIKQLRHRDPQKRKTAIKRLARDVDSSALKQLAKMAGDDPEPEIRELARNAGVYIRQQIGEIPTEPTKPGTQPKKIIVPKRNIEAAQNEVNAAMTYQMSGDDDKTRKALQKALALNPNLRHDDYFVSLCETVTSAGGADAVNALENPPEEGQKRGFLGLFGK